MEVLERENLAYCTKCGFKNEDDADHCTKCGASLQLSRTERRTMRKKREDECFGLPHGGIIVGIIFGVFIILWGLSQIPGLIPPQVSENFFWPGVIIVFGLLLVVGALYGLTRK